MVLLDFEWGKEPIKYKKKKKKIPEKSKVFQEDIKIFLSGFYFTNIQRAGEYGRNLFNSPLHLKHFYLLHRHLDTSQAIAADNTPLYTPNDWTRTDNPWFLRATC